MEVAREAAEAGGAAAMRHFVRNGQTRAPVQLKADRSPVTAADKEAEAAIVEVIRKAFPKHAILAEESGVLPGGTGESCRWIVDPLDGTRGFARGGSFWGPLVALEDKGNIVAGAMALPALGETYWAGKELGAFLNGEALRVSTVNDWSEATVSLGELGRLLAHPGVHSLITSCASVRCYGDLAACAMLLTGRADAWLEAGVQNWDLAALKILVEEAGGRFSDFGGNPSIASGKAIGSNGKLHERALGALRR
jgi:histidinol-phosphatase